MPNIIDSTGLIVDTLPEIIADLTAGYTTIYGSDINLGSNTPDGQQMTIYATALEDNLELLTSVNSQLSLQNAFGVQLDNLVALNGMQRQPGTYTKVYVQITVSQALTLPGQDVLIITPGAVVATVSDQAGNQYQLVNSYSFSGGITVATLEFVAVNIGQVLVTPNTISVIVTPLVGWTSVANPVVAVFDTGTTMAGSPQVTGIGDTSLMTAGMDIVGVGIPAGATLLSVDSPSQVTMDQNASAGASVPIEVFTPPTSTGINEETDVQLKIRHGLSFSLGATGPADTIQAQLRNTPGVIDAFVPDNDTNAPVNGVPANGIWVIVNAPTVPEATIAQVIYTKKGLGAAQLVTAGHHYTITRPAGNTFTAYWDKALTEDLYISFVILPINGVDTFNYSALADTLAAQLVYRLNQSSYIGDVIRAMQTIAPNGYLSNVFVDITPIPALQTVTPSDFQHYFTLNPANIVIT